MEETVLQLLQLLQQQEAAGGLHTRSGADTATTAEHKGLSHSSGKREADPQGDGRTAAVQPHGGRRRLKVSVEEREMQSLELQEEAINSMTIYSQPSSSRGPSGGLGSGLAGEGSHLSHEAASQRHAEAARERAKLRRLQAQVKALQRPCTHLCWLEAWQRPHGSHSVSLPQVKALEARLRLRAAEQQERVRAQQVRG